MTSTQQSGSVFQAWFPAPLDEQLREYAADERRSLSSAIRLAVEDKLSEDFAPAAKVEVAPAGSSRFGSRSGAGFEEDDG